MFPHLILSTLTIGLISSLSFPVAAITFIPPNEEPPRQTQGGASRGDVTFIPPSDDPPVNTSGAGSRDGTSNLRALLPSNHYGQTTQAYPSFFVYVPRTSSARLGFFSVLTEDGERHHQGYIPITDMGLLRLELPEAAPALETGRTYQWHFALITEDRLRPDSPRVSGWVRRVAPDEELKAVVGQSKGRRSLPLANAYGRQGIWYDALSTLADLRRNRPDASVVSQSWDDLLNQVGLAAIANEPFLHVPD